MDKKALDQSIWLLITAIAAFAVVFIMLTFFNRGSESTEKVMKGYIEALSEDFDKDSIRDFYDKSPCIAGEELIIAEDGTKYYYFADPKAKDGNTNYICSQDVFPDIMSRYQEIIPTSKNPVTSDKGVIPIIYKHPVIEKKTDVSTGQEVCILADKSCALALKYTYEQIKEEKKKDS